MKDFYKTKITVEFEVSTQFGPEAALSVIQNNIQFPAILSAVATKMESDYVPMFPETEENALIFKKLPITLR